MKQKLAVALVLILWLAAVLASCLPRGGAFGQGEAAPRPEFSGGPVMQTEP